MTKTKEKTKEKTIANIREVDDYLYGAICNIENNWFEFSEKAWERHQIGYAEFESAKAYVKETLENKIEYRTYMYHKELGKIIGSFELAKSDILGIGWSKFKELKKIAEIVGMDRKKFLVHIEKVKVLTIEETKKYVKNIIGEPTSGASVKFSIPLSADQLEMVEEGIRTAIEVNNLASEADALEFIVKQYLVSFGVDTDKVFGRKINVEE